VSTSTKGTMRAKSTPTSIFCCDVRHPSILPSHQTSPRQVGRCRRRCEDHTGVRVTPFSPRSVNPKIPSVVSQKNEAQTSINLLLPSLLLLRLFLWVKEITSFLLYYDHVEPLRCSGPDLSGCHQHSERIHLKLYVHSRCCPSVVLFVWAGCRRRSQMRLFSLRLNKQDFSFSMLDLEGGSAVVSGPFMAARCRSSSGAHQRDNFRRTQHDRLMDLGSLSRGFHSYKHLLLFEGILL
jgi:hypothetical protein